MNFHQCIRYCAWYAGTIAHFYRKGRDGWAWRKGLGTMLEEPLTDEPAQGWDENWL